MDRGRDRFPLWPHLRSAPTSRRGRPASAEEEAATREALQAEDDELEQTYAEADEMPEDVDQRLAEIETALAAFEQRPISLRSRRDRAAPAPSSASTARASCASSAAMSVPRTNRRSSRSRTIGRRNRCRDAGCQRRPTSSTAAKPSTPHRMRARRTGRGRGPAPISRQADDRADRLSHAGAARGARRAARRRLPRGAACALPQAVLPLRQRLLPGDRAEERRLRQPGAGPRRHRARGQRRCAASRMGRAACRRSPANSGTRSRRFDTDSRQALFAHCVSLTVNAVDRALQPAAEGHRPCRPSGRGARRSTWPRRAGRRRVENYLGRVTKARILERRARGARARTGAAHRAAEEGRDGRRRREAAARRLRLAARSRCARPAAHRHRHRRRDDFRAATKPPVEETAAIESETAIDEIAARGRS